MSRVGHASRGNGLLLGGLAGRMRRLTVGVIATVAAGACFAAAAQAQPPSGAIFTTVANGSEVNFNIYPSKADVYLDGGPGPGAPQTAAGLDDGVYVFQVTDPSGKTLLSTDPAQCREFTVQNGIIISTAPSPAGCAHVTGIDIDHGALTIQLLPYNDTPNPGGEYKVWATLVSNYACSDLTQVDCAAQGSKHGFVPGDSKTDNFKVGPTVPQEIDTRFFPSGQYGNWIDGLGITWTDPTGASNQKWSYYAPSLDINHEAHVEAASQGVNYITIGNQPGCTVGQVYVLGKLSGQTGPQTVAIKVSGTSQTFTLRVDVECL
jgi:hypothetical protein